MSLPATCPSEHQASADDQRRRPETTVLYEIVRDNLETLHGAIDDGALDVRLPKHAIKELNAYLDCGLLCRGFARIRCESCDESRLVAFSCKGRGFCPSCMGRKMCSTAANLIEDVLPEVALRQWVFTFPFQWRGRLAQDGALLSLLSRIVVAAVNSLYAKRAAACGAVRAKTGAITVVQRTSSDLRLNPHLHVVFLDGTYHERDSALVWQQLGHLKTSEVGEVLETAVRRLSPRTLGYDKPLCASLDGFTLHAATKASAFDVAGREALLRYVLRPPLAHTLLERQPDGLVRITRKRAYNDGTIAVDMDPLSLLCRLAMSVPPPRFPTVKYSGVLASASPWRSRIGPRPEKKTPPTTPSDTRQPAAKDAAKDAAPEASSTPRRASSYRPWAELLKRTFGIDVLECPTCGARMKLVAMLTEPKSVTRFLAGSARLRTCQLARSPEGRPIGRAPCFARRP